MKPAHLKAARLAAVSALGRNAEKVLAQLEAAGLTVVRTADLEQDAVILQPVRLNLREPWDGLSPIWAERPGHPDGDIVVLTVKEDAVAAVRKAAMLQQVQGDQVGVELDTHGEICRAWSFK